MKNRFYGKYYKIISDNNYVLASIISHSNGGDMIQIITPDGSYYIDDTNLFLVLDELLPLKK